MTDWINRVCKWRQVLAGWQLGTRSMSDPEAQAVRDHREVSIILRVEATALSRILIEKGIATKDELLATMLDEARMLDEAYSRRFPGMRSRDDGIEYDLPTASETMKGWRP